MYIAPDKRKHALAGTLIAGASIAAAVAAGYPQAAPAAAFLAALAAGVAKEAYDWWLNRRAAAAGLPPPHEVSAADAVATALPGLVLGIVADLVLSHGVL